MDRDVERTPDDPRPEPNARPAAEPHHPECPPESAAADAEQRDALAARYAAQLDEREQLQDYREDLRNAGHDKRDRAADERDRAADEREHAADERDDAANVRELLADRREAEADERELTDLERHMRADFGEAAAGQRDLDSPTDPGSYLTDGQPRPDPGEP